MKKSKLKISSGGVRQLQIYSMAAIPILLVILFCYVPMFGVIIGFKDYRFNLGIFGSEWVGLKNFEIFFSAKESWRIIRNTLSLNFMMIVANVFFSVALAVLLYRLTSRTKTKIFQTILITPHFLSWVVVGYMVYALLNPAYGLFNSILSHIGLTPVDWYSTPGIWPVILTIASVWKSVGMDSVIYYAALMGLDASLFEAAAIDGANERQITRKIKIPLIVPLISVMTIIKIGNIFRADFGLFYQLTRDVGTLYPTTDVIDTYIFRTMRVLGNMGMSTAVGLVQSVVGLIMVIITNHVSKKIDPDNGLF